MGKIIEVIADETSGMSFSSYKYCFDAVDQGGIKYDDDREIIWKEYGETERLKKPVNLEKEAKDRMRAGISSIFRFFLDGSRHTYKVDDIAYGKNVYPIIAGQIGVGCCKRIDKKMYPALPFERNLVIALPDKAFSTDSWGEKERTQKLLSKINDEIKLKNQYSIPFNQLLIYKTNQDKENYDTKGIAKIQDHMAELEKRMVADLVAAHKINHSNYLIKDGSIDYQKVSKSKSEETLNLSDRKIKNNYRRVIGVSKSFDPTKCYISGGGTNSNIVANLRLFERTPAYRYTSTRADADFCVWYLRIRDPRYTHGVFDGVLKIEKLIVTDEEDINGISTDDINHITACLINERNPVCYGNDNRWANHLYPIFLTEQYIKSRYISNNLFMQQF